jgi:protein required for attachment to host cells
MKNPSGQLRNKELKTEKAGSAPGKFAGFRSPHDLTGEKDPHEKAAVDFARKIAGYLAKQHSRNRFAGLTVVAEPKMKGRLKAEMDKGLLQKTEWINKDLGKLSVAQLREFNQARRV